MEKGQSLQQMMVEQLEFICKTKPILRQTSPWINSNDKIKSKMENYKILEENR